MEQAISLAKLALGQVSPNPAVGAVIVKDDEVVGQGYTQPPGSDHAEIVALKQAGERARGGVMNVTLEPCCHHGRTTPCTQAIIAAGITEVHLAMLDANPIVLGRGKEELERAGIRVYVGEHEAEAKQINEAYTKFITKGVDGFNVDRQVIVSDEVFTMPGDTGGLTDDRLFAAIFRNDVVERAFSRNLSLMGEVKNIISGRSQAWGARFRGCVHTPEAFLLSEKITYA